MIRGKGAIKEGCGRHDGKPVGPEDDEPMHVLIEGPDEETVERGQVRDTSETLPRRFLDTA